MKLRNKLTHEINIVKVDEDYFNIYKDDGEFVCPVTLKELNEGWEEYCEETNMHYSINQFGDVIDEVDGYMNETIDEMKQIGNYFETKEEAEKAVKKLKAWKRLKEAGFNFGGWSHTPITKSLTGYNLHIKAYSDKLADYMDDLHLLFGGEE